MLGFLCLFFCCVEYAELSEQLVAAQEEFNVHYRNNQDMRCRAEEPSRIKAGVESLTRDSSMLSRLLQQQMENVGAEDEDLLGAFSQWIEQKGLPCIV